MPENLSDNDSFRFKCRMCGTCCRDDREIILNPQDVFELSRALGLNTADFIAAHCTREDTAYAGFPILMLSTRNGACCFLDGDLCRVHASRPACCRNYPLGTIFETSGAERNILMEPSPGCLGFEDGDEFTPTEWRRAAGIDTLTPGIAMLRSAYTLAASRHPDTSLAPRIFSVLYDFDPLPGPQDPPDTPVPQTSAQAISILRARLLNLMFED